MEGLVNRGHDLRALLHDYPIDLVLNLHQAAMKNQKAELKGQVLGFAVAVMEALDTKLMGGKEKILEKWLKVIDGPAGQTKEVSRRKSTLSPSAIAFFSGLPQRTKG